MQIIYNTVKPFDKLLKKQKTKAGEQYRPMYYVVEQPVDEGLLLYHTMTKALLLLTPEEAEVYKTHPADLQELIGLWFLVPLDHNDRLLSCQIRNVAKITEKKSDAITSYTILTTTDCNARCFYCYEMGRPRVPMTKETAERTADYIIKHSKGEKVTLHWLGGEPLYNKKVITLITEQLQESGIEFKSTMISNGYLFDDETVTEAKELWKLERVQITLDGTEQTYNRCKAYIYKNVNPYKIVISNIHRLLEKGIHVAIRLNIDIHNSDNLTKLVEELQQEFRNSKGLIVYLHQLFEDSKGSVAMRKTEKRHDIFQKMIDLENRLKECGLRKNSGPKLQVKVNRCMADNDHSIVVFPLGNIGKCQHYTENNYIGHICNEQLDNNIIKEFKEVREIDECNSCFNFPDCFWLKMCEDQPHCYLEERQYLRHTTLQKMLEAYARFKNKNSGICNVQDDEMQDDEIQD